MKKNRKQWSLNIAFPAVWIVLLLSLTATFFVHRGLFYIQLAATIVVGALSVWHLLHRRRLFARYLSRLAQHLKQVNAEELENSPFPVMAMTEEGEVLWYNDLFRTQVLKKRDVIGETAAPFLGNVAPEELRHRSELQATYDGRRYTVLYKAVAVRTSTIYVLYYWDTTELEEIAEEYTQSQPVVLSVYIDNVDEIAQGARDSERAQIIGRVETLLEDWIGKTTGLIRKYENGRFLVLIEHRHLQKMLEDRFSILDTIRAEKVGEIAGITLSIGIGEGKDLRESEQMARQALDMALGRGGDQAAVRTPNGFDFYGGVSRGVERRGKVRTRVVAAALKELIEGCETVVAMGHRFSDLDCLGSAVAVAKIAREMGKAAYVAVNRKTTLAPELIERYDEAAEQDLFVDEETALRLINGNALLVITDTHSLGMLEFAAVYQKARQVVVIDHHRKMVEHIENALIFYHEPYASSASEMVTELAQYLSEKGISRMEAEGLLAGIVLDTRSFSMKSSVRTFEAAAYLRKRGADTIAVKKLFSGSMELYRLKTEIMACAEVYKNTVYACAKSGGTEVRIAAAQAANELLSIKGAEASFTLFEENGGINISARSYGDFNVQLVMEALGGGGHLAMAGTYLPNTTMERAVARLKEAIDYHITDRERMLQAHNTEI